MSIYVSMGVTAPGMIEQADLEKAKTIVAAQQKSDAEQAGAADSGDSADKKD
jgi:hypothetical protein